MCRCQSQLTGAIKALVRLLLKLYQGAIKVKVLFVVVCVVVCVAYLYVWLICMQWPPTLSRRSSADMYALSCNPAATTEILIFFACMRVMCVCVCVV